MAEFPSDEPILRITAGGRRSWARLKELWENRELVALLAWRDISVRYKQTVLGAAWAVLQPVLVMLVFSLFFGRLAKVPSDGLPYPLFVLSGLLPWQLFAFALTSSANSLVGNEHLVTKVYFPRLALPIAAILAGLPDFAIALGVLLVFMFAYGVAPTTAVWTIPAFLTLVLVAAVAVGLGLAALNVRYRDVRHALPFLAQIWMFATPIAYPSSLIPERWRSLYGLNPMASAVEGFRWALLGGVDFPGNMLVVSVTAVVLALWVGLVYFLRVERSFADVI